MAKNAASMQFTQGWDWIQSTPDRNTGLWDVVTTEATKSHILIRDPLVRTLNITTENSVSGSATVKATAIIFNLGSTPVVGTLTFTINGHSIRSQPVSIPSTGRSVEVSLEPLVLRNIKLWWPHTHGQPALYDASFTFESASLSGQEEEEEEKHLSQPPPLAAAVLSTLNTTVGLRTVLSSVDPVTRGRMFYINGHRIFIEGGNWIATDQFQRFAGNKKRYLDEVRMHAEMGLNLIRVWGGGLTERPEFFEACDQLGVLVMQEFWMSGDNNGRWAGSFEWPTNHKVYLDNAQDMVLMLRRHPSLLFWNCGNELFPVDQQQPGTNPNSGNPQVQVTLLKQLQAVIAANDPGRFYITSSMSNWTCWAGSCGDAYALAPQDGNYGINSLTEYFTRNPGLTYPNKTRMDNIAVSFQPEIGSVSTPVVESLRRFMSKEVLMDFPSSVGSPVVNETSHPIWWWHNYEYYTSNIADDDEASGAVAATADYTTAPPRAVHSVPGGGDHLDHLDHLERFGIPSTIEEYSMYAQLAQLQQYKALYEGFQHKAFEWYSAVIFWKSQSPWPVSLLWRSPSRE